jgi:hypothetical protein
MRAEREHEPVGRFESARDPDPSHSGDLESLAAILPPSTLAAWRTIAPAVPPQAYGGTALTAHVRHRMSRDLDFFTETPFDVDALAAAIDGIGTFAPTMVDEGTLNGLFESTKVQFLDASTQRLLEPTTLFGGVRLASMADIAATKLKVIQDRGALRDYFDLMVIDEHIPMEEGLRLLVEKYQPLAPAGLIANVVRGLGYLGDVEDDPSLPVPREQIESFWASRQPRLVRQAL